MAFSFVSLFLVLTAMIKFEKNFKGPFLFFFFFLRGHSYWFVFFLKAIGFFFFSKKEKSKEWLSNLVKLGHIIAKYISNMCFPGTA